MKKITTFLIASFILSVSFAQTRDVTVRFNGGWGSMIDSISILGKTYFPGSVIKIPASGTSDIICYVTYGSNVSGETNLQLYMKNKVVSDKIVFSKTKLMANSPGRATKGTFRGVNLANLESIVLIDNEK